MGWAGSKPIGEKRSATVLRWVDMKKERYLKDLCTGGKVMLKYILKKQQRIV
jgi:hypothetical protein